MIARQLESEITSGVFGPGERLGTKKDLRLRFGVASASVNEATKLLMMRGLLQARPGPGGGLFATRASTRVQLNPLLVGPQWVDATIDDYLCLNAVREPLVCREAARYRRAADLRVLRRLVSAMQQDLDEPFTYMRGSWALHRRIANLCRNALLQCLYTTLLDFLEDALERAEVWPENSLDHLARHRELVEAIAAGPGPRLEAAIDRHQPSWIHDQFGEVQPARLPPQGSDVSV